MYILSKIEMKSKIYFIPNEYLKDFIDGYDLPNECLGNKIKPYVIINFPDIKRGDALELETHFGYTGRKEHFMYWDGENVIPQCNDYYAYDGGGPPLCFKTFTEFPMNYFSETAWFGESVYLDYDTFVDQIRNWTTNEDDKELMITYKNKTYSLNLDESEACDSLSEYIDLIKTGNAKHIMLVNSNNRIVDIDGEEVY
jgi:hypothetical protein